MERAKQDPAMTAAQVYGILGKLEVIEEKLNKLDHIVFEPNGRMTLVEQAATNKLLIDSMNVSLGKLREDIQIVRNDMTVFKINFARLATIGMLGQVILIPLLLKFLGKWF